MSNILLMIVKGQLTDLNGKSIDDLNVDFENPVCDLSSGDEQEEKKRQPPDIVINIHEEQLNVPMNQLAHVNSPPYF